MTVLYGFKLDDRGRMMDRLFDLDKMPSDWYDSPDKVPGGKPKEVVETLTNIIVKAAKVEDSVLNPLQDLMQAERLAGEPQTLTVTDGVTWKRKGGRPKGSKNKV